MPDPRDRLNELLDDADDITRQRGRIYYQEGRVELLDPLPQGYRALVRGSGGVYAVFINPARPIANCSCPAYKPCKHIVAFAYALQGRPEIRTPDGVPARTSPTTKAKPASEVRLAAILNYDGEQCRIVRLSAEHGFRALPVEIIYFQKEPEIRRITPAHQPLLREVLAKNSVDRCKVRWLAEYLKARPPATPLEFFLPDGRSAQFAETRLPVRITLEQLRDSSLYRLRRESANPDIVLPSEQFAGEFFWPEMHAAARNPLPTRPRPRPRRSRPVEVYWIDWPAGPYGAWVRTHDWLTLEDALQFRGLLASLGVAGVESLPPVYARGPRWCVHLAPEMRADEGEPPIGAPNLEGRLELVYAEEAAHLKPPKVKRRSSPGAALVVDADEGPAQKTRPTPASPAPAPGAAIELQFVRDAPPLAGFPPLKLAGRRRTQIVSHPAGVAVKRSQRKESALIESGLPLACKVRSGEFRVTSRKVRAFFAEQLPALLASGVLVRLHPALAPLAANPYAARIEVRAGSGIDWFGAEIVIEGLSEEERRAVYRAWRSGQDYLSLNGRWLDLKAIGMGAVTDSLASVGVTMRLDGTLEELNRGQLLALDRETELRQRSKLRALQQWRESEPLVRADFKKAPPGFHGKLRGYQQEGARFLTRRLASGVGGILADDMGLGKTVQAIAFLAQLFSEEPRALVLIAGPVAALSVWKRELQRFAPDLPCHVWHGHTRRGARFPKQGIVLTSYGVLTRDARLLERARFRVALIDEAQFVKNHATEAARVLRSLKADAVFCLTGTPLENHLEDFWALMNLVLPGLLGTRSSFVRHFRAEDEDSLVRLKDRVAPFLLRRTKSDVLLDLPPRTQTDLPVSMTTRQAAIYEEARRNAVAALQKAGSSYLMTVLPHLTQLRRLACHPDLKSTAPDPAQSGKFEALAELLERVHESDSAALIFSQFTDVLNVTRVLLKRMGYACCYLDGSTSAGKREAEVERFQAGGVRFFLISLRAGGVALTLTRADTVIHLDPWWNPAVEQQATDRAHRMGQTRPVFVYRLYSEGTIEERVFQMQQQKRELFASLFEDGSGKMADLSREDLLALLAAGDRRA